ncbi:MAG TPA: MSHA biogenesis protein MshG [Gammaproteobacteria bacterium]|nr:MSHA biogenesis protein MshG [Gammaproteobacteria bacterium]
MSSYKYSGRNKAGEAVDGILEAHSTQEAADSLLRSDITPVNIEAISQDSAQESEDLLIHLGIEKTVSLNVLSTFCRQIATLVHAGVPILSALQGIITHVEDSTLRKAINGLIGDIEAGHSLSVSMLRFPRAFSSLLVSMVQVGENTGQLDKAFEQTFYYLEKEKTNRDRVKSALRYPFFVFIAILVAITIINIFVIPAFSRIFNNLGEDLPLVTQFLIGSSQFTLDYWPLLVIFTISTVIGLKMHLKTSKGRYQWDKLKLRLPIIGSIIQRATLARFSRAFAMASTAGIPIVQTLSVVSQAVDNRYLEERIVKMSEGLERGESLMQTAINSQLFTPLILQMISVGEESGAVDQMLSGVADFYEREVEYDTQKLNSTIEPILITVIGIIVLILALGIFLPMWSLGGAALGH